ncbi:MAG: rhodanese-like domain-containing protein [Thermodesulfobacteriota bacterium]
MSFATFINKAAEKDTVVVDVRSPIQRTRNLPGLKDVKVMEKPCNSFINDIVKKERMKDKTLLIFDQVGKQVKWLMYYMADKRYTDYYFLRGGVADVLQEQEYR